MPIENDQLKNSNSRLEQMLLLAKLITAIRGFFENEQFLELFPSPAVPHPGLEPHLHPLQLYSAHEKKTRPLFLNTSPEFAMKEALSLGLKNIFTLGYSFRDEPLSEFHRPQFLMLEWYRSPGTYQDIASDLKRLIQSCLRALGDSAIVKHEKFELAQTTVEELFLQHVGTSLAAITTTEKLKNFILEKHANLLPDQNAQLEWEDFFFLLFLNLVEPKLKHIPALLIFDYPMQIAALSERHSDQPHLCKRFELYLSGIEVANCFQELTDAREQRERSELQRQQKKKLYGYDLGEPTILLEALDKGITNPSAGIALGVERLLMALTNVKVPFWR